MECTLQFFFIFAFFAYICSVESQEGYEASKIGGEEAHDGQFPWNAALIISKPNRFPNLCGGALISTRWILTSGLCVQDAIHFKIILGLRMSNIEKNPHKVTVGADQYILHENYSNDGNFSDDNIALINLPEPVQINRYIKPVDLSSTKLLVNTNVTTCGWGMSVSLTPTLYSIDMVTTSDSDCRKLYQHFPVDAFCAEPYENQTRCGNDGGSPVTMTAPKGPVLVGIHTFGSKCTGGSLNGFVSTYHHREWIRKHAGI